MMAVMRICLVLVALAGPAICEDVANQLPGLSANSADAGTSGTSGASGVAGRADVELSPEEVYAAIRSLAEGVAEGAAAPTEPLAEDPDVQVDAGWTPQATLGQVSAVDTDAEGNVFVFHRGARSWDFGSFDSDNKITYKEPIAEKTILKLDKNTGAVLDSWGDNLFYMPHGLTVDQEDNVWVTDVGTHQVYKFPKGSHEASLTLGEKLVPGDDSAHYCKPTDVAVTDHGDFFVADGYCNGRILKYDKTGKLLTQWGKPSGALSVFMGNSVSESTFNVPHSLALAEDKNLICVADRENKRIQCFNAGLKDPKKTGDFAVQMSDKSVGRVYGVTYHPAEGGLLFAVTGPTASGRNLPPAAYVISFMEHDITDVWTPPEGFSAPHDVAVTSDLSAIYVAEVLPEGGGKLWRFIPATARAAAPDPYGAAYDDQYNYLYDLANQELVGGDEAAANQYLVGRDEAAANQGLDEGVGDEPILSM